MNIFTRLQTIDRRVLYLLIALVITVPLLVRPGRHPRVKFNEVRNAYKTISNVPKDKLVIISITWGPGTTAENGPQTEVMMRHLFQRGVKFAVVSWDQAGNELSYEIGKKLEKEMGKKYGVDWVHLGYRVYYPQVVFRGMAQNFQKVMEYDKFHTPLSKLPAVSGVKTSKDIGAVIEITPSGTLELWIAYFNGPYRIPLIYCPTAVMAAEAYPYIDSGQINGMLNGVIGAAQYEALIGMQNAKTDAAATSWALSAAHIFIILLIVVGNLGYLATKRAARGGNGGGR
ncbi:MAG: hypothetical protein ABFD54_06080 [Armatimonadota bacterium]|nr:hypothetical protein [bacterium]